MYLRFIILCFLVFLFSACTQVKTCAPNLKPLPLEDLSPDEQMIGTEIKKPHAFLGVAHRLVETDDFKQVEVSHGYLIDRVIPNSAADKMGFLAGDIILEFDGITLDLIAKEDRKLYLSQYIKKRKKIGDRICLKVLRQTSEIQVKDYKKTIRLKNKKELEKLIEELPPERKLTVTIDNKVKLLRFDAILGEKKNLAAKDLPANDQLFPEYENVTTHHITIINKLINHFDLQKEYLDIIARYSKDELWEDGFRLNLFRYLHRDPFKLIPVTEEKTSRVYEMSKNVSLTELLREGASWLDVSLFAGKGDFPVTNQAQPYLDYIREVIDKAWDLRQKAFEQLSAQELEYLEAELVALFDRFSLSYYIDRQEEPDDKIHNKKIIELAQKVDFSSLFMSALTLAELANPRWLADLQDSLQKEERSSAPKINGVSGQIFYTLSTKAGLVIIGGAERNTYKIPAAAIIDLGGDDLYIGQAGLVHGRQQLSAIIDVDGNDEYLATDIFAQGSGILGVGLLLDLEGDDLYVGTRFSQGCAALGNGMLEDLNGKDRYFGEELNQGAAFWGAGILLDADGNDYYQSNLFAQGVGGVKGLGALLDNAGDDFYFAGGRDKSSYGTSGIFNGSSQGLGIGFRGYVSGGIGMLLDGDGDDTFWAGNFSQGTGYFFGIGIIRNFGEGDDTYTASRYGQGASAHSAAGILIDDSGNDHYSGYHVALQGAAWDLGMAALVDKSGNDEYHEANGFAQAAASHNGMAFFIDESGLDLYFGKQARAEKNDYHGGSSLSFFIDAGGDHDIYSSGLNNSITVNGKFGIRADLEDTMQNIATKE